MKNMIKSISSLPAKAHLVHIVYSKDELKRLKLKKEELKYAQSMFTENKSILIPINRYEQWLFIHVVKQDENPDTQMEGLRKSGNQLQDIINKHRIQHIHLFDVRDNKDSLLAMAEGMALGNYQFIGYR
ncbi:MAG: hypothetical protein U9R60_16525, partial [Bacteroidota bacterium]|nr:hypothetical protein [Bacteroidota bacterium]